MIYKRKGVKRDSASMGGESIGGSKGMKIINKLVSALFKVNRVIKLFTQPIRYIGRSLTFGWLRKLWRLFK